MHAIRSAVVIIVLCIVHSISASIEFTCGKADGSVWPWHVAVFNMSNDFVAGGTIISDRYILTMAHTTFRKPKIEFLPFELYVLMAITDLSNIQNFKQHGNVSRIIRYPNYDMQSRLNDLALLELTDTIAFNEHVSPICLWSVGQQNMQKLGAEEHGTIVKWGYDGSTHNQVIHEYKMSIIDLQNCAELKKDIQSRLAKGRNFCAGYIDSLAICSSDGGGALYVVSGSTWYLRGISSQVSPAHATQLCEPKNEVIFLDATFYKKWIERYALPEQHNRLGMRTCGLRNYVEPPTEVDMILSANRNPWIAQLEYQFWDRFVLCDCHGLLIHQEFVLTLARCIVEQPNRKLVSVTLGKETVGPGAVDDRRLHIQKFTIRDTYLHDKFNKNGFGFDVGLVQLDFRVNFEENIQPICLPSTFEPIPHYSQLAWYRQDDHPKKLQTTLLQTVPFMSCSSLYRQKGVEMKTNDHLLCLKNSNVTIQLQSNGIYRNDFLEHNEDCVVPISGAPVFHTTHDGHNTYTYLIGMRSFGSDDCKDDLSDVYSNMVSLGPWIADTVEENALIMDDILTVAVDNFN